MATAPIFPVTYRDTFTRTIASGGWGTMDTGQTWFASESHWSVDGNDGKVTVATSGGSFDENNFGGNHGDAEMLGIFRWESATADADTDFGPIVKRSSNTNFYMVRLRNKANLVTISVIINGAMTNLVSVSYTLNQSTDYWVRTRFDNTGIYVKVWRTNVMEPTGWTVSTPYSTLAGAPPTGAMGVAFRRTTNEYNGYLREMFAYTLEDAAKTTMPMQDTFDREVDLGWGVASNGMVWEGNVSRDPRIFDQAGTVSDPGDGRATLSHPGSTDPKDERIGFLGPVVTGNVEVLVKFSMNTAVSLVYFGIGLRGSYTTSGDGTLDWTGYQIRLVGGGTNFALYRKTSLTGGYVSVTPTTNTAFTAMTLGTVYWVRFQINGTTLQAKIWADGSTEPGAFQFVATDSSITSGRLWLSFYQDIVSGTNAGRAVTIYDVTQTKTIQTNGTTTGAVSLVSSTSTALTIRAAFTGDANNDNSIFAFTLKDPDGVTIHDDFDTIPTRVTSPLSYTFAFTGLKPNTAYSFEAEFTDPQGVVGTNPVTGQFTTLNTAVQSGDLTVTAVGTTSIDLRLSYTGDIDNDSSATMEYRTASSFISIVEDGFEGNSGVELTQHSPEVGATWIKHLISTSDGVYVWRGRLYQQKAASGGRLIYFQNAPSGVSDYTIEADFFFAGLQGSVGLGGRISNTQVSGYFAYPVIDPLSTTWIWKIGSWDANVFTEIMSGVGPAFELGSIGHVEFTIANSYLALVVDGVEILHKDMTTNKVGTEFEHVGLQWFNEINESYPFTAENTVLVDNFKVRYRTYGGSWLSAGSMTADRGNKWFTKSVSGLAQDTVYNFRSTISDPDAVYGNTQEFIVATTIGQAAQIDSLVVIPRSTSAVVETTYLFDSNNNSSITVQYRPIYSLLWTTVTPKLIKVNRTTKKFTTTIVSLKPNLTYELLVTIDDPEGTVEGTSPTLSGLFTTKGPVDEKNKENKHYLWKVYDSDDKYITTWEDAGEPEFAWHENGGVSDLTVVLPRTVNDAANLKSGISHQNRVDIWCVDPSSDGFGPNLENDPDFDKGAWVLGSNASISTSGGPDDSDALLISTTSSTQVITRGDAIVLYRQPVGKSSKDYPIPLVVKALAKASGSKLTMFVESYNVAETKIDTSDTAETVGSDWQTIRLEYTPPTKARYVRVCFQNDGKGTMYADKVEVRPKELLIYRGRVETYTPRVEQDGEDITVEVLGLVSLLSDDYIEFLQYVAVQPAADFEAGKTNYGPADPGDMLKKIIDVAQKQNPRFDLYYTAESIRNTGFPMEYTFRDQQLRACFDKIRNLCPSGWHYYIEPDGLVVLRGPDQAPTYTLRIGVEIMNFSVERSIRNLKNFVHVKGRQDEDESEPDGFGSIHHIAFDQESIDKYGKRMLFIRDSNITTPDTAEFIANGRLEENNREEQRAQCYVPDDKSIYYVGGALRGANIEEFRPGDQIMILDPVAGPQATYWDQFLWDIDSWDSNQSFKPLPESVPIKTVQFSGTYATLELSERQPSSVGDFGRLYRWLQLQESND